MDEILGETGRLVGAHNIISLKDLVYSLLIIAWVVHLRSISNQSGIGGETEWLNRCKNP